MGPNLPKKLSHIKMTVCEKIRKSSTGKPFGILRSYFPQVGDICKFELPRNKNTFVINLPPGMLSL
jgi:hypothetical protein